MMKSDMEGFLKRICHFLEIPHVEIRSELVASKINKRLGGDNLRIMRFFNHFRRTELNPFPMLAINDSFLAAIRKSIRKIPLRADVFSDQIEHEIKDYYRASNIRLKKIVDEDPKPYIETYYE